MLPTGPDRELQTVRQAMIDFLQNHTDGNRPPACPALDPIRPSDVLSLIDNCDGHYVAILFESNSSYVGREVILDLIPYENIAVKRALAADGALLEKLGVSSVPSCYLIYPNGSHGLINIAKPLRSFFSSYLKSLPDVRKKSLSLPEKPNKEENSKVVWREFDRSRLYTADLESGLHYMLRVELAAHRSLAGAELRALKDFITVVAKLFPGRPPVRKLLEMLQEWLASLPLERIPYNAVLDLVNNKMRKECGSPSWSCRSGR